MTATIAERTLRQVEKAAIPITGSPGDHDGLIELVGNARFVLLGEATHGTHEFYRERARITARLIEEKGFDAVAVEADWPDAYRVNRYVRGMNDDADAKTALGGFKRFPQWMWRNGDVVNFAEWLKDYNRDRPPKRRAGFYGLDLYSLYSSMDHVIRYLEKTDPEAALMAKRRYDCFEVHNRDPHAYGFGLRYRYTPSCQDEVAAQLKDMLALTLKNSTASPVGLDEKLFDALQNARLVRNAEEYYRTMFFGAVSSWNLRDTHMAETLKFLSRHLDNGKDQPSRIVVWEHNSHVGDASATAMGDEGETNIGQLIRNEFLGNAVLVGFTTDSGYVTAASDWDAPAERKRVRPALAGSYENLFHQSATADFFLSFRDDAPLRAALYGPRLERAIGVVYRPETERLSHYFSSHLSRQFDAVYHFDQTRAVEPLEKTMSWEKGEFPETFPTGI